MLKLTGGSFGRKELPQGDAERSSTRSSDALAQDISEPTNEILARKAKVPCKFWATKNGCRIGDSCVYLHDTKARPGANNGEAGKQSKKLPAGNSPSQHKSVEWQTTNAPPSHAHSNNQSRAVPKPIPRRDPRDFQIDQLKRRFSPKITENVDGTSIEIQFPPSDPDFPFEMSSLNCVLHVPQAYPSLSVRPSLNVRNKEMGRGYQINIERGFQTIVTHMPQGTLLRWMNALDRRLEEFLSQEKAETVKIMVPKADEPKALPERRQVDQDGVRNTTNDAPKVPIDQQSLSKTLKGDSQDSQQYPLLAHDSNYAANQLEKASQQRKSECHQLEARMGRVAGFSCSKKNNAMVYQLPIEPRRRQDLPSALQTVKLLRLDVPERYPLHPSTIQLVGLDGCDAERVTKLWEKKQKQRNDGIRGTLIGRINELVSNMHVWAKETVEATETMGAQMSSPVAPPSTGSQEGDESSVEREQSFLAIHDDEKPHLHFVPRPLEWTINEGPHEDSLSDSLSSLSSSEDDSEDEDEGEDESIRLDGGTSSTVPHHGIAISFPSLRLHNIELLTLNPISLALKCLRCKNILEVTKILSGSLKSIACIKCSSVINITFCSELMHVASFRAGYLDIEGATPQDLLLSPFTPSCASCSNTLAGQGLMGVRGAEPRAVCRSCHQHMSFLITEIKFQSLSSYAARHATDLAPKKKKPKERLGLTTGEPLPKHGRCKHYGKSYRWFRFSCCDKVYACDRCHDDGEEHPNERADRMICGYCSREQRFRAEDCGICHAQVIGKKGGGFWEGGKGTRDRVKMSKKDKRKYRRAPGNTKGKAKAL